MTSTASAEAAGIQAHIFDPTQGITVRSAQQAAPGWWAGAPGANYDAATNTFYLVYRQRQPRELGRGVECRIAASDNGIVFSDIWALPKTSFDAISLERCAMVRGFDGRWRLYISYVSPTDNRWRIALMEADEPDRFDPSSLHVLMTAETTGTDGVKDPRVFTIGPMYYMLVSYAAIAGDLSREDEARKHATGDIYNTGLTLSRTAAAISPDGRTFRWIGDVSPVAGRAAIAMPGGTGGGAASEAGSGWDSYCRRIGSVLPLEAGGYVAFYDGSASVEENYEERTGIAVSFDMTNFWSITPDAPALVSPHGTGSLRYIDALLVGRELFFYYEVCCADGSHDLHVSVVDRPKTGWRTG